MQYGARTRAVGEILAALALPGAAAAYLHRLGGHPRFQIGWADLDLWLQTTPLGDAAAALLRLAGLAAACWILTSTLLYIAARASGVSAAIRAVDWATLPVVRRAADRAVAMTLAGTVLVSGAAPAIASDLPAWPPPPLHADAEPLPGTDGQPPIRSVPPLSTPLPGPRPPAAISPLGFQRGTLPDEPGIEVTGQEDAGSGDAAPTTRAEASAGPGPSPAERRQPAASAPAETSPYEVVAGDNLWAIAERTLAEAWGRRPQVAEVASYWHSLIERNLPGLRSGDPDLIYPGESLELPTVPTPEEASDG